MNNQGNRKRNRFVPLHELLARLDQGGQRVARFAAGMARKTADGGRKPRKSRNHTMRRAMATEESLTVRRAVRSGRPPRELAGEVNTRILDAAREVFLER